MERHRQGPRETMADRLALLTDFLDRHGWSGTAPDALADDCSFRRYFRLQDGERRAVVMDAPPAQEEVLPFMRISERLNRLGYSAPRIAQADVENGFLLLDDFGDATYTRALADGADEEALYRLAMDVLVDLHTRPAEQFEDLVPAYGDQKLLDEVMLFIDWYLISGLHLSIPDQSKAEFRAIWSDLLIVARAVPDALVLRDFHVDNMMVLPDRSGLGACGLLDFQDAVIGPLTYDIVSLLQDARRDIPDHIVAPLIADYLEHFSDTLSQGDFDRSYKVLGAHRALKVFGIFTRQSVLYGNHQYLVHIDRLWRHTIANLTLPELSPVREWIDHHVPDHLRLTPKPGVGVDPVPGGG
jgi:aminoglycoside/choline kinase family phosphotransferase